MARRSSVPALLSTTAIEMSPRESTKLARRILRAWEGESPTGSSNTATAKRRDLEAFAHWLEIGPAGDWDERTAEQVRIATVERFIFEGFANAQELARQWLAWMAVRVKVDGRSRARMAPATRARRLAHLRSLVRVAQEYGLPWSLQIRGPRVRPYRDTAGPEAWRVYSAIADLARTSLAADTATRRAKAARDCAILQLLFCLGLRRHSVVDLQLSDLDGAALWLRVKGEEEPVRRTLPKVLARSIEEWLLHRGRHAGPLFCATRGARARPLESKEIWRIATAHAGKPHGLRHAGATKLAREGHTVFELQAHLGHRNAMTAQHYVDTHEDAPGQTAAYLAEQLEELYDRADGDSGRVNLPDGA